MGELVEAGPQAMDFVLRRGCVVLNMDTVGRVKSIVRLRRLASRAALGLAQRAVGQ